MDILNYLLKPALLYVFVPIFFRCLGSPQRHATLSRSESFRMPSDIVLVAAARA